MHLHQGDMSTFDQKSLENIHQPTSCSCFGSPNSRNSIPCITAVSLALAERHHLSRLSLRILQHGEFGLTAVLHFVVVAVECILKSSNK